MGNAGFENILEMLEGFGEEIEDENEEESESQ